MAYNLEWPDQMSAFPTQNSATAKHKGSRNVNESQLCKLKISIEITLNKAMPFRIILDSTANVEFFLQKCIR